MLSQWHVLLRALVACLLVRINAQKRRNWNAHKGTRYYHSRSSGSHLFTNFRDERSYLFNPTLLKAFTTAAVRLMEAKSAKFPQGTGASTKLLNILQFGRTMKPRREEELSRHQGRNGRIVRTVVSDFPKSRDWGNHLRILHRNKSKVSRCSLNNCVTLCLTVVVVTLKR